MSSTSTVNFCLIKEIQILPPDLRNRCSVPLQAIANSVNLHLRSGIRVKKICYLSKSEHMSNATTVPEIW
jgi:hypothetical protein